MLTFYFTGADGKMTVSDVLTTGMVGRPVKFRFTSDWDNLEKTAVFVAGDRMAAVELEGTECEIPPQVLTRPGTRLYVGIYGCLENGTVVIPTIMAEGPTVRRGADPLEAPPGDPPISGYAKLQGQIGDLSKLDTEARDSLVSAVNELAGRLGGNENQGGGLSADAAALLITILRNVAYRTSQAANITALEAALAFNEEENEVTIVQSGNVLTISGMPAITSITQSGNVLTMI